METLAISRLLRQSKEVSRRLRAGESFVLTRGHELVGVLKPIPSATLERLEDVLHLTSAEFGLALDEYASATFPRGGMTRIFARQVKAAIKTCPAIAAEIAKAGEVLQGDRTVGTLVHAATAAPGVAAKLKQRHGKLRKVRLACTDSGQAEAEGLMYFAVSPRGEIVLLALFVKTHAGDVGAEGHARLAEAMRG